MQRKTFQEEKVNLFPFKCFFDPDNFLKINSLVSDNARLTAEVESLKKALDEAARQVKEIAVKVIEGRAAKQTNTSEE